MIYIHMHFVILIAFQFFNGRNEKHTEGRTDGRTDMWSYNRNVLGPLLMQPNIFYSPFSRLINIYLKQPSSLPTEMKTNPNFMT